VNNTRFYASQSSDLLVDQNFTVGVTTGVFHTEDVVVNHALHHALTVCILSVDFIFNRLVDSAVELAIRLLVFLDNFFIKRPHIWNTSGTGVKFESLKLGQIGILFNFECLDQCQIRQIKSNMPHLNNPIFPHFNLTMYRQNPGLIADCVKREKNKLSVFFY
jgi:hypothetical protein